MNAKTKAVFITTVVAALAITGAFAIYPALVTSASSTNSPNSTAPTANYASANGSLFFQGQGRSGPGNWGPGGFQGGGRGPGGPFSGHGFSQTAVNFTVGQAFTITSTEGEYSLVTNHSTNGTASGALTFTVTGKFSNGYTLSLTSGSLTINGVTYTISSGSAQMATSGNSLSGQGTTTPTGQFLIQAQAHGSFAGSISSVSLDFHNASAEYGIFLTGNVTN